ncbi:MAG TPA: hypothetical protein VFO36_13275, partial [Nitrospiraceae bacterium]|nr:hypothetical protein [Nitrospiraceae bacterium]
DGASLDLVLYPGGSAARARIAIAGLRPYRDYRTGLTEVHVVQANDLGRAQIDVPLHGRTALSIAPVI